jgi:hypothetical protein
MKVGVGHPSFLPWGGFWHAHTAVDSMIWSLGVDTSTGKGDHYHNRVRLNDTWLTLPVMKTEGKTWGALKASPRGCRKISKSLSSMIPSSAPYYSRIEALQTDLGTLGLDDENPPYLWLVNAWLYTTLDKDLPIDQAPLIYDFSRTNPEKSKTKWLIDLLRRYYPDGDLDYYCGSGGRDYLDPILMKKSGITTFVQTVSEAASRESAVKLFAYAENPLTELEKYFGWEKI